VLVLAAVAVVAVVGVGVGRLLATERACHGMLVSAWIRSAAGV